ncbi:hypothetical protein [Micromonospora inositola]|uniref:Uncharacterized protein n=1 Tax=Micromonospora inositola TaxID=47865 RepID=A0A1C5ITW9_9ACTN|nr:hypothetical protein [Micromonospora inositola]SCG61451.1 hypothetical protein GA0070613_3397 [Micromonospora inositola]
MTDHDLAALARDIDATCRLTGRFVLRSGRVADALRALLTRANLDAHRRA